MKKIIEYEKFKDEYIEGTRKITYYKIEQTSFWSIISVSILISFFITLIMADTPLERELEDLKLRYYEKQVDFNNTQEIMQNRYYDCRGDLWQCNQNLNKCLGVSE